MSLIDNISNKEISLFILSIGILISPYNLSAAEADSAEIKIITSETPVELNIETERAIVENPDEPETIEDLIQENQNTSSAIDTTEQLPLSILKEVVNPRRIKRT